jgi:FkbH-like protein
MAAACLLSRSVYGPDLMQRDLEYFPLLAESRSTSSACTTKLRLAVIADCATQLLRPLFLALFRRQGIEVELYEGAFGAMEIEARNPASGLYELQPEIVLVLHSVQALRDTWYRRQDPQSFYEEITRRLNSTWDSITSTSRALIIQSTFVAPAERIFGNYERKVGDSLSSAVSLLNSFIVNESTHRGNLLLLDLDGIASWAGRQCWFDERLWELGKSLCALEHLPLVAQNVVDIAVAARGKSVKCVVLDLDNTLWGGVVGDDGPHGIKINSHGEGESFFRFQFFLRELKKRGILLAVCSKNEEANAMRPFRENSEMVLRLEDIVVFVANWSDKPGNIQAIRQQLNIAFDAMLFLDDSPFERASVRALLPEVIVPELPEDHSDWVKSLSEMNLFETASFSTQDAERSGQYLEETRRRTAAETAPSFEAFLQSLDMTMEIERFSREHLGRIVQLLQRSNQFNLTTRRHNQAECEAMMNDVEGCIPLCATLKDRYGDHGLISIVILRPDSSTGVLAVVDWLMSCRVLGRGVEERLMNDVVRRAREKHLHVVQASYVPTAKNAMVKDFYARFGFEKINESDEGLSNWTLEVAAYENRSVRIRAAVEETSTT